MKFTAHFGIFAIAFAFVVNANAEFSIGDKVDVEHKSGLVEACKIVGFKDGETAIVKPLGISGLFKKYDANCSKLTPRVENESPEKAAKKIQLADLKYSKRVNGQVVLPSEPPLDGGRQIGPRTAR